MPRNKNYDSGAIEEGGEHTIQGDYKSDENDEDERFE